MQNLLGNNNNKQDNKVVGGEYGSIRINESLNQFENNFTNQATSHENNSPNEQQQHYFGSGGDVESVLTKTSIASMIVEGEDENYLRRIAIDWSLYFNIGITIMKLIAYIQTLSLSVLASLVDSVLDIVSQVVLNVTERHSQKQKRSSALYPAGAARLEPLGVLTCAALMGMASFEVIKEALQRLASIFVISKNTTTTTTNEDDDDDITWSSFWSMISIIIIKLILWYLCKRAAATAVEGRNNNTNQNFFSSLLPEWMQGQQHNINTDDEGTLNTAGNHTTPTTTHHQDQTLEVLAQDHWNDILSNAVAAVALWFALGDARLVFLDPIGAIIISIYIIYSWYETGREQIEQLTGKGAPQEFLNELYQIAQTFDERILMVDVIRAYHFGPKFLVEIEVVLPRDTLLYESHDLGMDLQYEIEGREEVERCFVHIDYESRPYDEHVVSKVPELRQQILRHQRRTMNTSYSV